VKISELSERSGVTIASIKYYIREGLIPAGGTTAPNQAHYGDRHLADLALIRALRDRAKLPIAAIRRVMAEVAAATGDRDGALEAGFKRVQLEKLADSEFAPEDRDSADYQMCWRELQALLAAHGWRQSEDDAVVQELLSAMMTARRVRPGGAFDSRAWDHYADLGERAARFEIPSDWDPDRFPADALRYAIVGTYLFEPVILAFRRLALSERSTELQAKRRSEAQRGTLAENAPDWLSLLESRGAPAARRPLSEDDETDPT
jgi:DNA-binding transcriptional MerR regulator